MIRDTEVLFVEGDQFARPIPSWVRAMIELGLQWPSDSDRNRRISFVSMPCDSGAFGLISLGLMMRDLGRKQASDISLHHQRVVDYARRYLRQNAAGAAPPAGGQLSGILKLIPKDPDKKPVKYQIVGVTSGPQPIVRVRQHQAKSKLNGSELAETNVTVNISARLSIEGAPLPEVRMVDHEIDTTPYLAICPDLSIEPANLKQSYTGLAIVGRTQGERATRQVLGEQRFNMNEKSYSLDEILRVQQWSDVTATRAQFLSARGDLKQLVVGTAPEILVIDGLQAFLKVIAREEFRYSDVVVVYSRACDRALLEELTGQIEQLLNYYEVIDVSIPSLLPSTVFMTTLEGC
jgi:hypothetical protein